MLRNRTLGMARLTQGARELFIRHGYNNVSVADIAYAVGLKKASIYNYAKSKEELALKTVQSISDDALASRDIILLLVRIGLDADGRGLDALTTEAARKLTTAAQQSNIEQLPSRVGHIILRAMGCNVAQEEAQHG